MYPYLLRAKQTQPSQLLLIHNVLPSPDHPSSSSLSSLQHINIFSVMGCSDWTYTLTQMLNRGGNITPLNLRATFLLIHCRMQLGFLNGFLDQDLPITFPTKMLSVLLAQSLYCCMVNYSNLDARLGICFCEFNEVSVSSFVLSRVLCNLPECRPPLFPGH